MRRFAWNSLSILVILILATCLGAWARSYFPRNSRFDIAEGRLLIVFWEGRAIPTYVANGNMIDPGDEKSYPGGGALWTRLQRGGSVNLTPGGKFELMGFGSLTAREITLSYHILAIPFWFLAIVAAAAAAAVLLLRRRYRFRLRSGHCLKCGYDLRESRDNCPECGTKIPATSVASV